MDKENKSKQSKEKKSKTVVIPRIAAPGFATPRCDKKYMCEECGVELNIYSMKRHEASARHIMRAAQIKE